MADAGDFDRNAYSVRADSDLAFAVKRPRTIFFGDGPPLTPEERKEQDRRLVERRAAEEAACVRVRAREVALREACEESPLALAVLTLHEAQTGLGSSAWCRSCGDSYDAAEWPCATVLAVAREVGFDGFE